MGKIKITIEDLFNISGAVIYNPDEYKPFSSVVIDSRKLKKGSLFVAVKGEKFDGHDFVFDAIKKGACAVVVDEKKFQGFDSLKIPVVTVKNTTKAFGEIAATWRNKLNAKIISITGSNGKTTVKEMTATLLSEKYRVVKTAANNNNHIGVPLTILSANEKCEALVLEQGTNHFNEIRYSTAISQPDYALITNIGYSHLEFLKNREGVYKEKSALLTATLNRGGKIFANTDDSIIIKKTKHFKNKITFGFRGFVDVKGKVLGFTNDGRTKIKITKGRKNFETVLPVYGKSNAQNFLAAAAIALEFGLTPHQIINGSKKLQPVHGRLEVKNFKDAVVIDDSYNASPASTELAIDLVKKIKTFKNKLFVLGDMFELGINSAKLHVSLAEKFSPSKNITVLTFGSLMKNLHKELRKMKVRSIHFHLREALSLYLKYEEIGKSVILVKGSRGMKMEEFVNILEKRFE